MSHDPLDYQVLLQEALRGLVRRSLEIVAEQGLPGEHHFYLSFRTDAPGVVIPPHMHDTYPDEMTIVLKTQFKDLTVTAEEFSVGLFFSGVLYFLTIPFEALVTFSDPAAGFQLMFEPVAAEEMEEAQPAEAMELAAGEAAEGAPADNVVAFSGFRKKK